MKFFFHMGCQAFTFKNKQCSSKTSTYGPHKKTGVLGWYCGKHIKKDVVAPVVKQVSIPFGSSFNGYQWQTTDYSPNQQNASNEIMQLFKMGKRYVTLTAPPQSGKSGTIICTSHMFISHFKAHVSNILVIVPMIDVCIRRQAINNFAGMGVPESNILSIPQLGNGYLKKWYRNIKLYNQKGLIIIDESHCDTTLKDSTSTKLVQELEDIGIYLNLRRKLPDDLYILSVSATPHAEIAGLLYGPEYRNIYNIDKATVYLEPGEGYYGFTQMLANNRVKNSFEISKEEDIPRLFELCNKYRHLAKYAIIRVSAKKPINPTELCKKISDYFEARGIFSMISNCKTDNDRDINELTLKPCTRFTPIFIVNRLRASIRVNTSNVCMVFENINADSTRTAQGLPGRACGYGKASHQVDIYCNKHQLELMEQWYTKKFDPTCIPRSKDITGGVKDSKDEHHWEKNVPIQARLDNPTANYFHDLAVGFNNGKLNPNFYAQHANALKTAFHLDSLIPAEYNTPIKGNGLMVCTEKNSLRGLDFLKTARKAYNESETIIGFDVSSDTTNRHGYYAYINLCAGTADYGKAYICFTKHLGTNKIHVNSEPSAKSAFHQSHGFSRLKLRT